MNRIETRFAQLKAADRKALIPFVTAGDPSLEALVPVMHALVEAGADVIELGVPFSDPMADGPTIQRSSERALARGAGLSYVFESVRAFRQRDAATPVVRSEEHTSELQSLMRISYAVFCLKKKKHKANSYRH